MTLVNTTLLNTKATQVMPKRGQVCPRVTTARGEGARKPRYRKRRLLGYVVIRQGSVVVVRFSIPVVEFRHQRQCGVLCVFVLCHNAFTNVPNIQSRCRVPTMTAK